MRKLLLHYHLHFNYSMRCAGLLLVLLWLSCKRLSTPDHRGGPASAAHVDILANHELLADIVALAAGKHVDQRVLTNIDSIAGAVWSRANTLD